MRTNIKLKVFLGSFHASYVLFPIALRQHLPLTQWQFMDASDRFEWLILQYNHFDVLVSFCEFAHLDKQAWMSNSYYQRHKNIENMLETWLEKSNYDFLYATLNSSKPVMQQLQVDKAKKKLKRKKGYEFFNGCENRDIKKSRKSAEFICK